MKFSNILIVGTVAIIGTAVIYTTPSFNQRGLSLFSDQNDLEIEQAFVNYIAKYGKSYSSKHEIPDRFNAFKNTYLIVKQHNQNAETTSKLTINHLADYIPSENEQNILEDIKGIEKLDPQVLQNIMDKNLTLGYDWRDDDRVAEVYDQGNCQSSWAIATSSTLTSAMAIKNNQTAQDLQISVQYLLDCDPYNRGCARGLTWNAYNFIRRKGYVLWNDYPTGYLGVQRPCKTPQWGIKRMNEMMPLMFPPLTVDQMKRLVSHQPVTVLLNTPTCFRSYSSGVLRDQDCQCTSSSYFSAEVEQSAVVVGYSTSMLTLGCQGYWIIKNSYGEKWGENGYVRLCIPIDTKKEYLGMCNVQAFVQLPQVGLIQFDEE